VARLAILSDIHGNLEALKEVLRDIEDQQVDDIYCLGDVIGYGPNPRECIELCMNFKLTLLGNHDNGALFDPDGFSKGAESAVFWTRQQIEHEHTDAARARWDFIARLPRTHREGNTMFVHGSPRSPLNEYVFPEDIYNQRKIERIFGFIFYLPAEIGNRYKVGDQKLMINVGSVGQPRDGDPRSSYVIFDGEEIEFRRVEYDAQQPRQKILAIAELDDFLGDRLLEGR